MENLFYEYMNRRFNEGFELISSPSDPGPVITISRQAGCGASRLAHDLCKVLNENLVKNGKPEVWHFINHEILEQAAEKLEVDPAKLDRVITDKERGIMDEIVEALTSHIHKSDHKIMKTTQGVIRQIAEKGHVIIVGRGGAVVNQHIVRALHLRIEAPLEWRIGEIMKKLQYSRGYATEYVKTVDEHRHMYVQKLAHGISPDSIYDAILNPSKFSHQQMVAVILSMASAKGLF